MGRMLVLTGPKQIEVQAYVDPPLGPGEVRVQTLYSGISAGTELTQYRGSNPNMHKRWDAAQRLFILSETGSQPYPLRGWGYEEVGEVVEVGAEVADVRVGETIYGVWGHRTTHIVTEAYARERRLPRGVEAVVGIFSRIGAIALNGVHDAGVRVGETVAVFGLGVVGQIVAQLAKVSGATVVGVDLHAARLDLAQRLGAIDVAVRPDAGGAAEQIKALTGGRGADVSIEVTGAGGALSEAIRATAYSATVVAMGFFQGEVRGLYLGEEFHHNRIRVVCSQIGGVAPELSQRWNALRLSQTVMRLAGEGGLRLEPLISHTFAFEEAAAAFRLLDERPSGAMQIVLDMRAG